MSLLDLIYPKRCVGCRKWGEYLCADCFSFVSYTDRGFCTVCQRAAIDGFTHPVCRSRYGVDGVFSCVAYSGVVKRLIRQFKYSPYVLDLRSLLDELFYEGIIQKEHFVKLLTEKSVFVPVPLYKSRLRKRGYNQAEVLAKGLVKRMANETIIMQDCLERVKETRPQYGLTQKERVVNMDGAFVVRQDFEKNLENAQIVILVDDIVTTGTTMREAARVLKRAGVKRVYGAALAHGI